MPRWSPVTQPVIGMVHLPPLPGSPHSSGDRETLRTALFRDAEILAGEGIDALMLENFGDSPFFADRVPAWTISWMTALAVELRSRFAIPLGINVLRNDGRAALAIAHAAGAQFIRVNILCGARLTDQGVITGCAAELLRERALLRAEDIEILADVAVKHSAPLALRPVTEEVEETLHRGGADGIIVTGTGTGRATDLAELALVRAAARPSPVFVGSGITAENIAAYRELADGFIVGSEFKQDGIATNPVEPQRVRRFLERFRSGD